MLIDCIEKLIRGENKFINNNPVINMNKITSRSELKQDKSYVQFRFILLNLKQLNYLNIYWNRQLYIFINRLSNLFNFKAFHLTPFKITLLLYFYAWQGRKIKISQNFQNETIMKYFIKST
jgi:hypothetical protein